MIKYGDSEKKQSEKLVGYKDVIANMTNLPDIEEKNRFLLKNKVEYA